MLIVKTSYLPSIDVEFCSLLDAANKLIGLHLVDYWMDPLSVSMSSLLGIIVGGPIAVYSFSDLATYQGRVNSCYIRYPSLPSPEWD